MNKRLTAVLAVITGLLSSTAYATPGEYWEITAKMEMPGMPFAMPATTTKVCIAKGNENDPRKSSGDKDCQMSDIKTVGKKTTFKVRCDHDGEIMTGTGEQTLTANGTESKIHFSGKSRGRDMDMTMTSSGKRIGGSCNPEEIAKARQKEADKQGAQASKALAQNQKITAEMCDLSNKKSVELIQNKNWYLGQKMPCAGKDKEFCNLIRKDAASDIKAYEMLVEDDKIAVQLQRDEKSLKVISIVKECKLNISASLKSICHTITFKNINQLSKYCPSEAKALCKTINGKNYDQLSGFCPAEAKTFRETHRREYCESRGYTAEIEAHIKDCIARHGQDDEDDPATNGGEDMGSSPSKAESKKSNPSKSKSDERHNASETQESSTSTNMLEGAKKMKGLFGF